MFNSNFLLRLISPQNSSYYISKILFLSILVVIDFFTLFILGGYLGIYLYLGCLGLIIAFSTIYVIRQLYKESNSLEKISQKGEYPEKEFFSITGLYLAAILIIIPGIITTLIGIFMSLPKVRAYFGKNLSTKLEIDWNGVYEYREIYKP